MDYVNIALTKGRLADITVELFEKIGISFTDYFSNSRKLIFANEEEGMRLVLVKARDVPIYVEQGVADIGIVGKDTLLDTKANVYEIMDLKFGKCRFAVAALEEYTGNMDRKTRVATKYVNVAKTFFQKKGEPIEIIKLSGSVELAPIMGLSDVIVDIVETGTTLKENGLVILENICEVSARLIANKASFKTKADQVEKIIKALECTV